MNRRNTVLVGLVYTLAITGILAAVVVVAGLWPGARAGQPTAGQVARNEPAVDPNIPTIRPIWPAEGATAVRSTRTPTLAPTRPAPGATATQPAPGATATLPGASGTPAPSKPGPAPSTATAAAPSPTSRPTAVATGTSVPPTAILAPTNTPSPVPSTPTTTPTATAAASTPLPAGSISGQVLFKGASPSRPLTMTLETTDYVIVASTRAAADGSFIFSHVAGVPDGYNVVFSQDDNPQLQSEIKEYATWAWLGPVRVSGGRVDVPAFDIALVTRNRQPWSPISPASDASFRPGETIQFEWPSFADNAQYWLDITRGENLAAVWQSPLQMQTKASWNGINAGEYWWAIGARWGVAPAYTFTIYSYFTRLVLAP